MPLLFPPPAGATSSIAAALPVSGMTLSVGTAGSPDSQSVIANIEDYNQAMKSTVVMVTNVGDTFVRRQPTLIDPGEVTFKIFWIPLEPSHRNSADSGTVAAGLRYLLLNKLLRNFEVTYPADPNGNVGVDDYKAFVTDFGVTGKVGGVFEASITLGINDAQPSFV
jgi:hypothetical protein